jgi:hypothetical protein
LDTQSVDGTTLRQQDSEMSGVAAIAKKNGGNILTGDASWFMLEYQHAVKWSLSRENVSERVRQQIGTKNLC